MKTTSTDRTDWAALVPELSVADIQVSLHFYCNTLGFTERFSRPEAHFSYLELGRAQLMLEQMPDDETEIWKTGALHPPLGRGMHFQIEVANVSAIHDRCVSDGYALFRPLETAWYREHDHENGQTQFLIQDPDGYLLRFMQHLGRRPVSRPNL